MSELSSQQKKVLLYLLASVSRQVAGGESPILLNTLRQDLTKKTISAHRVSLEPLSHEKIKNPCHMDQQTIYETVLSLSEVGFIHLQQRGKGLEIGLTQKGITSYLKEENLQEAIKLLNYRNRIRADVKTSDPAREKLYALAGKQPGDISLASEPPREVIELSSVEEVLLGVFGPRKVNALMEKLREKAHAPGAAVE